MSRHAGPPRPPGAPVVPEPTYAERARTLAHLGRTGTLATLSRRHPGHPFGSVMPYALDGGGRVGNVPPIDRARLRRGAGDVHPAPAPGAIPLRDRQIEQRLIGAGDLEHVVAVGRIVQRDAGAEESARPDGRVRLRVHQRAPRPVRHVGESPARLVHADAPALRIDDQHVGAERRRQRMPVLTGDVDADGEAIGRLERRLDDGDAAAVGPGPRPHDDLGGSGRAGAEQPDDQPGSRPALCPRAEMLLDRSHSRVAVNGQI